MRLRLTLAIYHLELWLDLGELESVAQCETFFGEGGLLAYLAIVTFWLYEIVLKPKHSIQNLGSCQCLFHLC